ncbi:MAG: hypothetical protein IJJ60_15350 [Clostridia bacterium]|nr:hypothetical protein [Clostridia bacterium]
MQNYEELFNTLQAMDKSLKDSAGAVAKLQKAIQKNTETGNLNEVKKGLSALTDAVEQLKARAASMDAEVNGFDTKAYFMDGDFTRQLLDACAEKDIDAKGEKGVYEMFPYKVRVLSDEEHAGEVYIDRKKAPSCRPAYVADLIRTGQAKLYAAPFKAAAFMSELSDAYEITCLRSGARIGSTQALNKIYKSMVPMARARKDYDMQAFAFDLARLYEEGPDAWVTKNGTQYAFGTSRDGASGIRVLSRAGVESFISTLRSLNSGNE